MTTENTGCVPPGQDYRIGTARTMSVDTDAPLPQICCCLFRGSCASRITDMVVFP